MQSAVVATLSAMILCLAPSQGRDLHSDLKGLNVRHTTAHYALAGTVTDAKLRDYGQALELAHREYANGFGEMLDRKKPGRDDNAVERFRVVILAKAAEYEEFTGAYFGEGAENTTGQFVPATKLLIIRDQEDRERTYGTLFHEAFHQFARRHMPAISIWLNEGLATYYGSARPVRGGLVFDRRESGFFRLVKEAARQGQLIPLRELITSTRAAFYEQSPVDGLTADRKTLCYAESYTLTSYMINDNAGRDFLRKYMRALSDVGTTEEAQRITREMFTDKLLVAMIKPWLAHVGQ